MSQVEYSPHLFHRQACDTDESFEAFREYRDQPPPRQLRYTKYGQEKMRKWHSEHNWKARVATFDAWMDELRTQHYGDALKQPAREVAAQHMSILQNMRDMLRREVDKWQELISENKGAPFLRMSDLLRLTDAVVKYDRLVRGEVTERTGDEYDYSKLTAEELVTLQSILTKTRVDV